MKKFNDIFEEEERIIRKITCPCQFDCSKMKGRNKAEVSYKNIFLTFP